MAADPNSKRQHAGGVGLAAEQAAIIQHVQNAAQFPALHQFYKKILKFSNNDLEQQQSLWKTNNMNFPDWFAPYHQEHPSACLRLNHTQGRGCPKGSSCSFAHMCILCGEKNHGAFQRQEGSDVFKCRFQRQFLKELTDSGYAEKDLLEAVAAEKSRPADTAPYRGKTG